MRSIDYIEVAAMGTVAVSVVLSAYLLVFLAT